MPIGVCRAERRNDSIKGAKLAWFLEEEGVADVGLEVQFGGGNQIGEGMAVVDRVELVSGAVCDERWRGDRRCSRWPGRFRCMRRRDRRLPHPLRLPLREVLIAHDPMIVLGRQPRRTNPPAATS